VKAFSQFGTDMVQLAHLSGDRQNVSVKNYACLYVSDSSHHMHITGNVN